MALETAIHAAATTGARTFATVATLEGGPSGAAAPEAPAVVEPPAEAPDASESAGTDRAESGGSEHGA